jgi:hypothetical protein
LDDHDPVASGRTQVRIISDHVRDLHRIWV